MVHFAFACILRIKEWRVCAVAVILSYICKTTHEMHAKRMRRSELALDPVLEALTVESLRLAFLCLPLVSPDVFCKNLW